MTKVNITIHTDGQVQVNGRYLNIDSEVSITGERGKFVYKGFSHSSEGKMILHFVGGAENHEKMRAFYPHRIKTIHNRNKRKRR